jgi:hypothetical protein
MKSPVSISPVLAIAATLAVAAFAGPAQAQNYPWCALYGTPYSDTSCGFVSYEQCMASVSGVGGFCQKNDTYKPPVAVQPQARRHHPKNS